MHIEILISICTCKTLSSLKIKLSFSSRGSPWLGRRECIVCCVFAGGQDYLLDPEKASHHLMPQLFDIAMWASNYRFAELAGRDFVVTVLASYPHKKSCTSSDSTVGRHLILFSRLSIACYEVPSSSRHPSVFGCQSARSRSRRVIDCFTTPFFLSCDVYRGCPLLKYWWRIGGLSYLTWVCTVLNHKPARIRTRCRFQFSLDPSSSYSVGTIQTSYQRSD